MQNISQSPKIALFNDNIYLRSNDQAQGEITTLHMELNVKLIGLRLDYFPKESSDNNYHAHLHMTPNTPKKILKTP